ncbi:MAG: competence protein ComK [Bacilli bacterium]|nr:competence protein ComK [Bacilli bacterium]
MYEIDLSTLMLIGLGNDNTKVITSDTDFVINTNCNKIVDDSCEYFGSSLSDRIKMTNKLIKVSSKAPIIIEESRNIIFFPLKSVRDNNNIWISFNNLDNYQKYGKKTILNFKCGKSITIDFSYYIIDNQVTRSIMLDYELIMRRKSLQK